MVEVCVAEEEAGVIVGTAPIEVVVGSGISVEAGYMKAAFVGSYMEDVDSKWYSSAVDVAEFAEALNVTGSLTFYTVPLAV